MRYYIIAGEASGDIYGAKLIQHLKDVDQSAQFQYWGGSKMLDHDNNQIVSIDQTAFMGFWEVLKNLRAISALFKIAKNSILKFAPDILILIDYPGFNLRLAKWAHEQNIKVCYYISPQLWAWKKKRYKQIKSFVDKLIVILPFEVDFYKNLDIDAEYYGHPLTEDIAYSRTKNNLESKIALYPGSRKQELIKHLPILNKLVKLHTQEDFIIAGLSELEGMYKKILENKNVTITYDLEISKSNIKSALVSSGTATLELALHKIPMVVFYKTSSISYLIGKRLVQVPFISLVNLIAGKAVVEELIQKDANPKRLSHALNKLNSKTSNLEMMAAFDHIRNKLSQTQSNPSFEAASSIYNYVNKLT